ncbi:hypothetical protein [Methanoplanus endosymbiosus]|uniref:Uncharacterized protein n=1 Tax=Methanoplanus endosymbiosus TaxID=33865 RepID=A0A9E7PQ22_9EURY|nr:hypothetical protein [Methanoplanus endosymbiosus]UUX93347.1 hypothetical protein L6E24_04260 [Methanoplanus endosymbiosus]
MKIIKSGKWIILTVVLISALLTVPVMGAPVVDRDVSVNGDKATVTFTVESDEPFAVGIVETVPEGWTFAEDESMVSASDNFETDRKNGKIAFFLSDEKSVSYELTGNGDGKTGFKTEWVDLLTLTPDMNEGKERWTAPGDSNAPEEKGSADSGAEKSPGFGIIAGIAAFITAGAVLTVSGRREA